MLRLQDGALEPPKMILTTRCSSWKVPGDLLPYWSSSSRLGERFRPFTVIEPGPLGLLWSDAIGEGATFSCSVVGVFVPRVLGVDKPVELLQVKGGTLLRPVGDNDVIVGAALAIAGLG